MQAWAEYHPGEHKALADPFKKLKPDWEQPKLGLVFEDPIPSKGFSECRLQFTDGELSEYLRTDDFDLGPCSVIQQVYACDPHVAQVRDRSNRL